MQATDEALYVVQCVAKRRRQLERLEFALEATARRVCATQTTKWPLYSAKAQLETQRSFARLLLDALRKEDERQLGAQHLFASAIPLEEYADTMPRLLELRNEEDHVAQRTDVMWHVIRGRTAAGQAVVDDATREIFAQCELKWLALVYGSMYLDPMIRKLEKLHEREQSAERPFAKWQLSSSNDDCGHGILVPKTLFNIRPAWWSTTASRGQRPLTEPERALY